MLAVACEKMRKRIFPFYQFDEEHVCISSFTGRDISNIMWAVVVMPAVTPAGVDLICYFGEHIVNLVKGSWLMPLDLANIAWALASLL